MPARTSGPAASLRRTVAPALSNLRAYWGTAALLVGTAGIALAALLPVTSLVVPGKAGLVARLGVAPWRGGDLGIAWSALAWSPTVARHAALVMLFRLLIGVAAGVLAVAGLTIVSLSAARASQCAPEVSLRRAVGASRRHVFVAALCETTAIAVGALILGGALGAVAARAAVAGWPDAVGPASHAADVVAVVVLVGGIMVGAILPLAFPRRTSPLPVSSARPLELFVPALQLGLSLTVLTAAALLEREAAGLTLSGHATPASGQIFEVTAPESPAAARAVAYASLLRQLGTRPTLGTVSLTSPGTLVGLGMVDFVTTDCGKCSQGGLPLQLHALPATHYLVSADTFRVLGLGVIAGRGISDSDRWGTDHVAVVSQSLAARHFQQGTAVGRRILLGGTQADWYTVVGVVDDLRPVGFGGGLQPPEAVYLSVLQHPARAVDLLLRAPADSGAITALERGLRATVGARGTQVARVSASARAAAEAAPLRWFADVFGIEGSVILAIATLGTFVVMRLWVVSRLHELGLRRAVGARRRDVFGFVLSRAAGVAIGGVAIGLWVGLVAWGTLATVVAGLPPWDLVTALRIAPLLIGATLAGALLPAWRAAHSSPVGLLTP